MAFPILTLVTALGLAPSSHTAALPRCVPDWRIDLIAESPQVKHPSVVCAAPDGRVFVAEDPMDISAPANAALGRILCFYPDGRRTVFAEKLYAVFGMQYLEGKLYVLHNPRFSVFDDDAGVGTNRIDLIESTNPNPWALDWNDHVPANFRLAMDGYFYVAVGDKGIYGARGRDGIPVNLYGGGILRLRPDGTKLEVYCTGVRNILDVALNDEDELFTYDNTDENHWMGRLTHMVDGGFYGYPYDFVPRRPYTLWMMEDYGGGAATGALAYNEDALPPDYHGNLFLADFGKRQIMRVAVNRQGATYSAGLRQDLFPDPPADFRPVGIALSSDGLGIYICDWQHRDTKAKVEVGRLLKLSYTGQSHAAIKPAWFLPAAMGKAFQASDAELINGLSHPAHSVRMTAQRKLAARPSAAASLVALIQNADAPARAKLHAVWALDAIDGGKAARTVLLKAAESAEPSLRRQAIRQLGARSVLESRDVLLRQLRAEDASVRFQSATALGRIADPQSVSNLLAALDEKDLFTRFAVFTALNRIGRKNETSWAAIASGLKSESPAIREGTAFAVRETYDVDLLAALRELLVSPEAPIVARRMALDLVANMHRQFPPWRGEWWAYHPALAPPPQKTADWACTASVLALLRQALLDSNAVLRAASMDGLRLARATNAAASLRGVFASERNPELKAKALETLGSFSDPMAKDLVIQALDAAGSNNETLLLAAIGAGAQIRGDAIAEALTRFIRTKSNPNLLRRGISALGEMRAAHAVRAISQHAHQPDLETRLTAIEALKQIGNDEARAAILSLMADLSAEIRKKAIAALGSLKDKSLVPALLNRYEDLETRPALIAALAQTPDIRALDAYLEGMAAKDTTLREQSRKAIQAIGAEAWPTIERRVGQLSPEAIRELRAVYRDDPRARSSALFTTETRVAEPADYSAYGLRQGGDAIRGKHLFFDAAGVGCAKCHTVHGQGTAIGPDLSSIGAQYDRANLIDSILYPSKVMREGYAQTIVETHDDESISGLLKADTAEQITLQDAEGRLRSIAKARIKERRSSQLSLMPEGLQAGLTLEEFADLLAFLESLKGQSDAKPLNPQN